jgi:hypothetical protein
MQRCGLPLQKTNARSAKKIIEVHRKEIERLSPLVRHRPSKWPTRDAFKKDLEQAETSLREQKLSVSNENCGLELGVDESTIRRMKRKL